MLSDRITELFRLLQCSNTDIARFAGCSPSNISRLKSGLTRPKPGSRAARRLSEGIYRYADYEIMLGMLGELCHTEDTSAETMIPAIAAWLYAESDYPAPSAVTPRSKLQLERQRHSFGERLDMAMTLLRIENGKLARVLNIDVSVVSRYRCGVLYPNRNEPIKERLCDHLMNRAERTGRKDELAALCGVEAEELSPESLAEWLFDAAEDRPAEMAETLFRSIDTFTPGSGIPSAPPQLPSIQEAETYRGTEGLRSAVVRFLTDAVREGGELLLYSDEPMDWMTGDREYFALWASLMVACVQNGVHIRIIHNVDRIGPEMVDAIHGWFPLYMSGMIEPYVFRKMRNPRFCHTLFLRPGGAAIQSFFPVEAGEDRLYEYITDNEHLTVLEHGYEAMLSSASPFLKTYPIAEAEELWNFCGENPPKKWVSILNGLTLPTMPEGLLERMLDREGIAGAQRALLLERYELRRQQLSDMLAQGSVDDILCLPEPEAVARGNVTLNLSVEMIGLSLHYTPEEYAEHLASIRELVNREKNYHLTLLPQAPFRGLQIFTLKDAVAVLRCQEPNTAFVFMNKTLTRSVSDYCNYLIEQYAADRYTTTRALSGDAK